MLTQADKQQIEGRGMTVAQVEHQLAEIAQGFPFLKLEGAAAVGKGITVEDAEGQEKAIARWQAYKDAGHKIVKFVPVGRSQPNVQEHVRVPQCRLRGA